MNKVEW